MQFYKLSNNNLVSADYTENPISPREYEHLGTMYNFEN